MTRVGRMSARSTAAVEIELQSNRDELLWGMGVGPGSTWLWFPDACSCLRMSWAALSITTYEKLLQSPKIQKPTAFFQRTLRLSNGGAWGSESVSSLSESSRRLHELVELPITLEFRSPKGPKVSVS